MRWDEFRKHFGKQTSLLIMQLLFLMIFMQTKPSIYRKTLRPTTGEMRERQRLAERRKSLTAWTIKGDKGKVVSRLVGRIRRSGSVSSDNETTFQYADEHRTKGEAELYPADEKLASGKHFSLKQRFSSLKVKPTTRWPRQHKFSNSLKGLQTESWISFAH